MDYLYWIVFGLCYFSFFGSIIWQIHQLKKQVVELTKQIDSVESNLNALTTRLRIKNGNP